MSDSPSEDAHNQSPVGPPGESALLMRRLAQGDADAADEVFRRYVGRLTWLARSRLSRKLAARVDPDDVVMSAWRSFFVRARDGAFSIERGGDLWRLLVEITLHKLYRQAARHTAERRSIHREEPMPTELSAMPADGEPLPDVAVAAADELEAILAELAPDVRRALEMRLQGYEWKEIAAALGKSDRTLRRWMQSIREAFRRRAPELAAFSEPAIADATAVVRSAPSPRDEPADAVGALLSYRDFVLQRLIGEGATGKVYRALDRRRESTVAVKFLKKSFLRDAEVLARFQSEAATVLKLRHPRIVTVHGLGRTPHRGFFLVMDLVDGGDLARRAAAGHIAVGDAIRWVRDAAEAIAFAHGRGVIHCDLKPANLLLDGDRVRVTDFGLARTITAQQGVDALAGTPPFMAPEQIDGCWGPITARTDVYGLGAVLFSLLAGRPPFIGQRAVDVLADVVSGCPAPSIEMLRPDLPAVVVEACLRCLAKDPQARFSTAEEFAAALSV